MHSVAALQSETRMNVTYYPFVYTHTIGSTSAHNTSSDTASLAIIAQLNSWRRVYACDASDVAHRVSCLAASQADVETHVFMASARTAEDR